MFIFFLLWRYSFPSIFLFLPSIFTFLQCGYVSPWAAWGQRLCSIFVSHMHSTSAGSWWAPNNVYCMSKACPPCLWNYLGATFFLLTSNNNYKMSLGAQFPTPDPTPCEKFALPPGVCISTRGHCFVRGCSSLQYQEPAQLRGPRPALSSIFTNELMTLSFPLQQCLQK